MSYEGHEQIICLRGHYYERDAADRSLPFCTCGADVGWCNQVDDTNCDSYGEIPLKLLVEKFQITAEVVETCNLRHSHVTAPAVFRVPTYEETRKLQHYRPGYGGTPLILIKE
jgi:hypothetical protein